MLITFTLKGNDEENPGMVMPVLDPGVEKGRFVLERGDAAEVRVCETIGDKDRPMRPKSNRYDITPVENRWYHASVWPDDREGEPDYVLSFKREEAYLVLFCEGDWMAGGAEMRIVLPL